MSGGAAPAGSSKKVAEVQGGIDETKLNNDILEKERDFYFGKLRDIEVFLQSHGENTVQENILKILYATEDDKVEINDQGIVSIASVGEDGENEAKDEKAEDKMADVEDEEQLMDAGLEDEEQLNA